VHTKRIRKNEELKNSLIKYLTHSLISAIIKIVKEKQPHSPRRADRRENMKINEMRGNQFLPGNCIYRPENYPEDWRERLEAGEAISYEEDGKQCQIWLEEEEEEEEE
jgi:hypothetical protein